MGRLDDKVAVVLGGSSGIGEATARRFIAEGARVLISARGTEKLEKVAEEIGAGWLPCDVTDWSSAKALAEGVVERFGRLDIAINSAGMEDMSPIANLEPERVEAMVAVQFTGALYFIQHMANAMVDGGSIVTLSSLTGTIVAEGYAPYAGAKAGINHASRIAAVEYGAKGVRVNLVSPSVVETPMVADMLAAPGMRDAFEAELPLGQIPELDDVVHAIVYLASDEARRVTGENIHIDSGGNLGRLPTTAEIVSKIQAAVARQSKQAAEELS
jgi:NAD(P)-dependent dehydrogenase (short-subunit alcohol dehydrogenase family)